MAHLRPEELVRLRKRGRRKGRFARSLAVPGESEPRPWTLDIWADILAWWRNRVTARRDAWRTLARCWWRANPSLDLASWGATGLCGPEIFPMGGNLMRLRPLQTLRPEISGEFGIYKIVLLFKVYKRYAKVYRFQCNCTWFYGCYYNNICIRVPF